MTAVRYDLLHPKALRAALIEHVGDERRPLKEKVVPTERQVRRWISGDTPWPGWAKKATDELLDTQKEAAPSMTRRLLAGVIALERRAKISPDEFASAEESAAAIEAAMEVDARIAAELEASRRRSGGRTVDQDGEQSAGSQGSKRRKR